MIRERLSEPYLYSYLCILCMIMIEHMRFLERASVSMPVMAELGCKHAWHGMAFNC